MKESTQIEASSLAAQFGPTKFRLQLDVRLQDGIWGGGGGISLEESRNKQRERVAIENRMHILSELVGIGVEKDGSDKEQVIGIDHRSPVLEYLSSFH